MILGLAGLRCWPTPFIHRDRGMGADADQTTLDALAIRGVVLCESMFRRTLQNLDADALDDAAGACAPSAHRPAMTWRAASRWLR